MNNLTLFILLLCVIFIYGIIFTIKNRQTKIIVENFQEQEKNFMNYQLKELNKISEKNIYQSQMKTFTTGFWTTDESYMNGSNVLNTMYINLDDDANRYLTIFNKKYPINFVGNGVIMTDTVDGSNLLINFKKFTETNDMKQPFTSITGLPRGVVYVQGVNEKVFLTYKLLNGAQLDENQNELKRIIENKIFTYETPALNYDVKTYKILTTNYRYPDNMINFTNSTIPLKNIAKWRIDKIKNNMDGKIMFAYKRMYTGPNLELVITQLSQRYSLPAFDSNGLHNQITIGKAQDELLLNGITNSFNLFGTLVYYFYIIKDTQSITLGNQPKITSNDQCIKAGGNSYNYCQSSGVHYCCGACNGEATCGSNGGLRWCACESLNEMNKNQLQLSGGISNSFSDTIRYPDLSQVVKSSTNVYGAWPLWFPTDDLNKTYTFTVWDQNLTV
jgi:hypothetical protein